MVEQVGFPLAGAARRPASVRRGRSGWVGLAILVAALLCAALPQTIAPYNPGIPDFHTSLEAPSAAHPFGTDALGRDQLTRVIYAARVSLAVGIAALFAAGAVGGTVGVLSGFFGGWVDAVLMRLADVQLSFSFLVLALTINAVIGGGVRNVILSLGIAGWPLYARMVRAETLTLRRRAYVQAAVASGARARRIIWRHVLPNAVGALVVATSAQVSQFIVAEATISFLGFGVQLPTPSWGTMIGEQRDYLTMAWWLSAFPGAALACTVLGVNLAGDWLRVVLDPRRRA